MWFDDVSKLCFTLVSPRSLKKINQKKYFSVMQQHFRHIICLCAELICLNCKLPIRFSGWFTLEQHIVYGKFNLIPFNWFLLGDLNSFFSVVMPSLRRWFCCEIFFIVYFIPPCHIHVTFVNTLRHNCVTKWE